jgi:ubiquinone/menaquinone biosynthesis C-methylase UbiE
MTKQKDLTPERIMRFAWGYAPTMILATAVEHRLFDLLDGKPRDVKTLARETRLSERGLEILLNALVGLEFLRRDDGKYALTPESETFLVSSKPAYYGGFFRHVHTGILPNWLQLPDIVRTGKPAQSVNQKKGAEFFADFVESLFPLSHAAASQLGEHLGVPKKQQPYQVLDLAAGSGVWGISLALQSPQVRITAVDWPEVLKVTRAVAGRHGVADRLQTVAGDLLEVDFGTGHHLATLGHILHSEGVERSRRLLKKTFIALAPGGTIAVMEFLPNDERTGPEMALLFAVNMLVHTDHGNTYTFAEISSWLREAGFVNPRLLEVPAVSPLVLADRP